MSSSETRLKANRCRIGASTIAKLASGSVPFAGRDVGEAIQAAARVVLACKWGTSVYWYGPHTAEELAMADVELLLTWCDTLSSMFAPDTERQPNELDELEEEESWHGEASDEDPGDDPGE